jgi:ParB-like chromosome segregation protein Spo0J
MATIRPELRRLAVPVGDLKPHPRNPRRGDVDSIKVSLSRFGQVRPILARKETGEIVAGNHTYRAAVELEWKKVAALLLDLTDDEALAYLAADNRLAERGGYDDAALASVLRDLADRELLEGTGYSPNDVEDLLDLMKAPDLDQLTESMGESRPEDFWPVLRFKVPPKVEARFKRLTSAEDSSDPNALILLMDLADSARRKD